MTNETFDVLVREFADKVRALSTDALVIVLVRKPKDDTVIVAYKGANRELVMDTINSMATAEHSTAVLKKREPS